MQTHLHMQPQSAVPAGLLSAGSEDPLITLAAPAMDSRIALISPGALDLACSMLRRGYQTVSVVWLDDRMPAHQFDIVIIPRPATAEFIARAVPLARRLLAPMGAIALRLAPDGPEALRAWARQQLALNGFTAVRVATAAGETLIGAELPMHGQLRVTARPMQGVAQ